MFVRNARNGRAMVNRTNAVAQVKQRNHAVKRRLDSAEQ